jgi:hypothetical protein
MRLPAMEGFTPRMCLARATFYIRIAERERSLMRRQRAMQAARRWTRFAEDLLADRPRPDHA